MIDIGHVLVIINNGFFVGCPRFFGKVQIGAQYGTVEHGRVQD